MARILVIEDEADIAAVISEALTGDGFDVATAENGAVGMAKARDWPPDLITLDLMMPVVDGWHFLHQYRQTPGAADTPILVLSAFHGAPFEPLETCEFLPKPFDLFKLLDTVGRMVTLDPRPRRPPNVDAYH